MIRRGQLVSVVVGLVVVAASIAHAQVAPPASGSAASPASTGAMPETGFVDQANIALEIDDCGVKPDVPVDRLRAIASEHYQRGEVLYIQGDYPGAVTELVASYCLLPYFSVLKDVGQAYERQLDYPRAIAYLSRYIRDIPDDAKQAAACGVDPQADRATVSARIQVLSELKARILVDTLPTGATITLTGAGGVSGRATSGQLIEVPGGRYQMVVELAGFHRVERTITPEIGKPYTFFERLKPVEGHLRVQVTPNDARIFVDTRFVGVGRYDASVPSGDYVVSTQAEERVSVTRKVSVLPDREHDEVIEMPPEPQVGRRQLWLYSSVGGAAVGTSLLAATKNNSLQGLGFVGGLAGGFIGGYYGIPHDQPLGTSSLTITSSLVGVVGGAAIAQVISSNTNLTQTLGGAGALIGAAIGYSAGTHLDIATGDAALFNSGALWGSVAGGLFTLTFNTTGRTSGGLLLGGLAMGSIGGGLLAHNIPISRVHAALVDVAGLSGVLGALAVESVIYQGQQSQSMMVSVVVRERLANFALGGMAVGLIVGGLLTRNIDAPVIQIAPTIGGAVAPDGKTSLTYGFGGAF